MKTKEEILEPFIKSYWDSHEFDNALCEEGEYVPYNDAVEAMEEYSKEQNESINDIYDELYTKAEILSRENKQLWNQIKLEQKAYGLLKEKTDELVNMLECVIQNILPIGEYEKSLAQRAIENYKNER